MSAAMHFTLQNHSTMFRVVYSPSPAKFHYAPLALVSRISTGQIVWGPNSPLSAFMCDNW
jgi:hypothetical protein